MSGRFTGLLVGLCSAALVVGCSPQFPALSPGDASPDNADRRAKPRVAFEQTFDQWKTMVAELRDLELAYHTARKRTQSGIAEQFEATLAEGRMLEVELIDTAVRAFAAEREVNADLETFLIWIASLFVVQEHYEDGLRIAQLLVENDVENMTVYDCVAKAAFACNEFDMAEDYLRILAKEEGELYTGIERLRRIPYYKKEWERERRLRETERLADDLPRVLLRTNRGEIELELFENEAPNTVANFISLVEQKFYDDLTFHKVIPEFASQTGCPEGNGEGGPGYSIRCECDQPDRRVHFRGSVSMVHHGRDTGGSRFQMMFVPVPRLDAKHTVFGRIVRGLEVLAKLQLRGENPFSQTISPDRILEARVLRKRPHSYQPEVIPDLWRMQRERQQEWLDFCK